tara:strand:+ start:1167 stop:1586 length:420 start_codon:yes stop_codon:yes gene_type:complete
MIFFNNKEKNPVKDIDLIKVAALLIHTAKIDENYSSKEEEIIKQALLEMGVNKEDLDNTLDKGKEIEANSIQILDFTREIKNMSEKNKIKIIESLWRIIYSNKEADMYETSLMRRLAGLLYIDSKVMGNIKDKIKKENL